MKRERYHHGELRSALVSAATQIIQESGIEGFSLREAARRAGVSASAPAHHFGSTKGLLTEVALDGYASLGEYLSKPTPSGEAATDIASISLAYINFALDNPGVFRLMFRNDLVDRSDPRYLSTTTAALRPFATAASAYGKLRGMQDMEDRLALFALWSAIHGMAHLVLEEKINGLFDVTSVRAWADTQLPVVLQTIWHSHSVG